MTSARDRADRRLGLVLALLALAVPLAGAVDEEGTPTARGEEPNPLESVRIGAALAGLEERTRLVQDMINESARQYRQIALERAAADQELVTAQERLDREAVRAREVTASSLSALYRDVLSARARVDVARQEADARLHELRRMLGERDALARRVADLKTRLPMQEEVLTGVWEVTWMPAGVQGTFYLDQSGTLVTGQYRLGSYGSGSLQGTFVNGKLFLQRIDAERGRDAEIEGVLDPDGSRIRGTWQGYEMVQGGIPQGQWVAKRAR
jgi:hypothetical protein